MGLIFAGVIVHAQRILRKTCKQQSVNVEVLSGLETNFNNV